MDRRAWWATVHGVAKSQPGLTVNNNNNAIRKGKKKNALKANNRMKSQRTRLRATEVEKIKMHLESTNSS